VGSPSTCLDSHFPFLAVLGCAKKSLALLLGQTMYSESEMLALCYVIKLKTPELPWMLELPLIGSKKSSTLNEDSDCDITTF
jgi:hypothetical protein